MLDIKLLSTKELLDELETRFDDIIFCGREANVKGKGDTSYVHFFRGDGIILDGMCVHLKGVIKDGTEE